MYNEQQKDVLGYFQVSDVLNDDGTVDEDGSKIIGNMMEGLPEDDRQLQDHDCHASPEDGCPACPQAEDDGMVSPEEVFGFAEMGMRPLEK